MSIEIVRGVSRENPELLHLNIGPSCYAHTVKLIEKLRARGHEAYLIAKSRGEGQYTPPDFQARTVTGLDGKVYVCTGVSHDAIWCDGEQFDTIGSANEHDRPIYRKDGDPGWSFNPSDGPQIRAFPVWNKIPREHWRPNNPPLKEGVALAPTPAPVSPVVKSYPGDRFFIEQIGQVLELDYAEAGQRLNAGSSVWFARTLWRHVNEGMSMDQSVAQSRKEWRAALNLPPLP